VLAKSGDGCAGAVAAALWTLPMKRVPNRIKKRNLSESSLARASYFASRFGTRFIGNPEGAVSQRGGNSAGTTVLPQHNHEVSNSTARPRQDQESFAHPLNMAPVKWRMNIVRP
jgi:hypothetical protein